MHLNLIFLEKLIFLILLKAKSLFSLDMLRGDSKGQGWPLTFQPRSLILEAYQYIKTQFSQKSLGQLNSNFIWRLLKLSGVNLNQMLMVTSSKWRPCPYKVKTLEISSTLELKGQWPWDLVYSIGDVGPTRFAQMMNLAWPWSLLRQGQIWFLMHLYWKKSWNVHFSFIQGHSYSTALYMSKNLFLRIHWAVWTQISYVVFSG